MLIYQTELEQLCEEAIREQDQEKLQELTDQILRLLAERQRRAHQAH